jgi:Tfp pilus assembly protein PilX
MKCRGMALLTGLVLMAAISLLALTAAGGMSLQRQQAANHEDKARATERSGLASSHALAWLLSRQDSERQAGCIRDCLLPDGVLGPGEVPEQAAFETAAWWRSNATSAGAHPLSGERLGFAALAGDDALWLLEEVHYETLPEPELDGTASGVGYYRILARGKGRNLRSVSVSEAIVARPWGGVYEPASYPPDRPSAAFCGQFEPSLPCGMLAWRERR